MTHLDILRKHVTLLPEDERDVMAALYEIMDGEDDKRPCLFFLFTDLESYENLEFESKARRGVFQLWGRSEGDTVAIVVDDGGKVYAVEPHLVKFIHKNK